MRRKTLSCVETRRNRGQVPNRVDCGLDDPDLTACAHDIAVLDQPAQLERLSHLRQGQAGLGYRNGWTDIDAVLNLCLEILRDPMSPRIQGNDPLAGSP